MSIKYSLGVRELKFKGRTRFMTENLEEQKKDLEALSEILKEIKEGEVIFVSVFGKNIAISNIRKEEAQMGKCRVRTHRHIE